METSQNNYYLPAATPQQLLDFKSHVPETHTASRFLNHMLTLYERGIRTQKELAAEMNLRSVTFSEMVRGETGMSFRDFVDYKRAHAIHHMMCQLEEGKKVYSDIVRESVDFNQLKSFMDKDTYRKLRQNINTDLKRRYMEEYALLPSNTGFADRSSLWRFVHSKRYHQIVAELGLKPLVIKSNR